MMYDDSESPNWTRLRRQPFPIQVVDSSPPSPIREFIADGVAWLVWERACADPKSGAPTRCLFFHGVHDTRRVCEYPASWHELSDAALFDLSRDT